MDLSKTFKFSRCQSISAENELYFHIRKNVFVGFWVQLMVTQSWIVTTTSCRYNTEEQHKLNRSTIMTQLTASQIAAKSLGSCVPSASLLCTKSTTSWLLFEFLYKVQYTESSEVQLHMNTRPLKGLNIPNSIAGNNEKFIVVSKYSCLDIRHGCNHLFLKWKRLILLVEVVTFTHT